LGIFADQEKGKTQTIKNQIVTDRAPRGTESPFKISSPLSHFVRFWILSIFLFPVFRVLQSGRGFPVILAQFF
jgi:hypothetical protein